MITRQTIEKSEENVARAYQIDDFNRIVIYQIPSPITGKDDFIVSQQCRLWMDVPKIQHPTFSDIRDADDHVVVNELRRFRQERAAFTGKGINEKDKEY